MTDVKTRPTQINFKVNGTHAWYGDLGVKLLLLALLVTCGLGMSKSADCQTLYGSITGSVTDSTGAAVPDATVTATQIETNASRTETTNGSGDYTLLSVPPGTYRIVITRPGFAVFQTQNVTVRLNAVARVNATLGVGATKQSVTVSAETAELQTDRSDVNAEIPSMDFEDLPQPTRTFEGLLGGVAGVGTPTAIIMQTNNPERSMILEANGTSSSATQVRVEGVPTTDPWVPYGTSLVPSVEDIQTVSMVTGSAQADQTLASGATINVQLKSGTNHFHGELYWFHNDNLFAAAPYFSTPGSPLPPNLDNDLGGTLGGPILKNRLFFFASYEGDFQHSSYVSTATIPTAAMLGGDFTATNTIIYDPNTGNSDGTGKLSFLQETGNNAIPASRINSNIKPLLTLISQLKPTNSAFTSNLVGVIGTPQTLQKIDTKLDWNATKKLRVTGRFNVHPYKILSVPNSLGDALNQGDPYNSSGDTYATTIAATYVASPHFLIDGSWGFTRTIQKIIPFYDNVKYGADTMHIAGVNLPALPYGGGMPQFNINGYSGYGYQYPYLKYNDPIISYAANATWTRGNHSIKFGTNINQEHMNHNEVSPDSLNFGGNATTLNGGAQANQFNGFASLLLGLPDSWNNSFQPFKVSSLRSWQFSIYAADTWQLSKKMTLTYGTGWTYLPLPTHGNYGLENYNLSTNVYEVCGFGGIPRNCGIDVGKGQLSP
ncbi:MAG: carboxypeptidase regulatory-like domain-containing protein, partial [Acidobacteriaceae bacterium]